jgi:Holliday junction resolvase-like predicted endonuclease
MRLVGIALGGDGACRDRYDAEAAVGGGVRAIGKVSEMQELGKAVLAVSKSSRHSKITGDFAESLVLYWLSKYGFECARVDHTGIDLIARQPKSTEVMGISVKSRSRQAGREGSYLSIPNEHLGKVGEACEAFLCKPYFSLVVDEPDCIWLFILAMARLLELFPKGQRCVAWKMTPTWVDRYVSDPQIATVRFRHETLTWWG